MAYNERALYNKDARRLFSGKDGVILSADSGEILSTVESFQAQVSFTNTSYQPLGSPIQQEFMTGYSVTLTINECVIEDHKFIRDVFDFFNNGRHAPHWNFSSVLFGYNGSEERMVFYDCIPSGSLDLINLTVGDILKRTWTMRVQQPPVLQKLLSF